MGRSQDNHDLLESYFPPSAKLSSEIEIKQFCREIRRTVIANGGQGDCVSVTKLMSEILSDLGVQHYRVSMEEGTYFDGSDKAPHAWIRIPNGELGIGSGDLILDPTSEQFIERKSDVHVLSAGGEFASEHYDSSR